MNYKHTSMFVLFVLVLLTSSAQENVYAASTNIVPNSSLETNSAEEPAWPDSWFPDFYGSLTPVFSYPAPGHTGRGARVSVTDYEDGDAKWFFIPQPIQGNHTYSFTDFYKANVPTRIIIQFTMASGVFRYRDIGTAPASSAWKQFTTSFTAPRNARKVSIFHVIDSNGTLSVDDYTLVDADAVVPPPPPPPPESTSTPPDSTSTPPNPPDATSTPPDHIVPTTPFPHTHLPEVSGNLIENPSLEDGTPGNPTGWAADSWGTNDPVFDYPVAGHTGARAARVTMNTYTDGDAKWFFSKIPTAPNTDYVYSDYYKSTAKTVAIIQFTLANGNRNYIILDVLPPASSWTKMEQTFNTPPNTAYVTVFHVITGVGSLTIDDASLVKLASGSFSAGMVSLSFDDADLSFLTQAVPLLNEAGLKASQNITTGFVGQDQKMTFPQLTTINQQGYEIDSHSVSHPYLTALSAQGAMNEISSSRTTLLGNGLSPVTTFAYPFGDYNDSIEGLVRTAGYTAARGTTPGFNTKNTDIYALHTQNVESDTTVDQVKQWIDYAASSKTWLILGFHEISDTLIDIYNYQTQQFADILSYLKTSNINVVTTNSALLQMR